MSRQSRGPTRQTEQLQTKLGVTTEAKLWYWTIIRQAQRPALTSSIRLARNFNIDNATYIDPVTVGWGHENPV
jgi:hypothetical protein